MCSDKLVELIIEHCRNRKSKRGPYKLQESLEKAKSADATFTDRIIVDESEQAWGAFYVARKAAQSQHGFKGKTELLRLFTTLSTQSIEERQKFAKGLAAQFSSETRQSMEVSGDERPEPARKRHCMCFAFYFVVEPNIT
jgi:hypothetical protein